MRAAWRERSFRRTAPPKRPLLSVPLAGKLVELTSAQTIRRLTGLTRQDASEAADCCGYRYSCDGEADARSASRTRQLRCPITRTTMSFLADGRDPLSAGPAAISVAPVLALESPTFHGTPLAAPAGALANGGEPPSPGRALALTVSFLYHIPNLLACSASNILRDAAKGLRRSSGRRHRPRATPCGVTPGRRFIVATSIQYGAFDPTRDPARSQKTFFGATISFLLFYAIAFPKGGAKVGDIPITIGYIMTGILLGLAILRVMTSVNNIMLPVDRLLCILTCLMLGIWSLLVTHVNGTSSTGYTISYFISVLYLPLFGLIFFSGLIMDEYSHSLEKVLLWAIRFIVIYGIFLFLVKQFTGKWVQIPYVTVNVDDLGGLDDKYINRGGVFKLISTYNNGNILGVSMLIVAPLYLRIENKKILKFAFYVTMFLTLSRTVWIGTVLVVSFRSLSNGVRPIAILYLIAGLAAASGAILLVLHLLNADVSFIFDGDLGGRAPQLKVLDNVRMFPEDQIAPLPEIVYLGMLRFFGIPGFLLFVAHLAIPPLLLKLEGARLLSPSRVSACQQGMLIYVVIACADAGFSFIPVMMIFWMVAGMGFWYARRQVWLVKDAREAVS